MKKITTLFFSLLFFIVSVGCNSNATIEKSNALSDDIPTLYTDVFEPFTDYVSEKSFDFVKEELSNFHYAIEIKDTSIYISDDLGHSVNIVAQNDIICLVQYATAEKSVAVSDSLHTAQTPIFITSSGNVSNLEELKTFMFS